MYEACELPDGFQYELAGVQHIDFVTLDLQEGVSQLVAQLGPSQTSVQQMRDNPWREPRVAAVTTILVVVVLLIGVLVVSFTSVAAGPASTGAPRLQRFSVGELENCVTEHDSAFALDTGLRLVVGTEVTVLALGETLPRGVLVAYLGPQPIAIGSTEVVPAVRSEGTLRLGFWDLGGMCGDNTGAVRIVVFATTA